MKTLTEEKIQEYVSKTRLFLSSPKGIEQQANLKKLGAKEVERKIQAIIYSTHVITYETLTIIYERLTGNSFFMDKEKESK